MWRSLVLFGFACSGCGGTSGENEAPTTDDASTSVDSDGFDAAAEAELDSGAPADTGEGETVGTDAPPGYPFPTPIQYVVVIVKENHTFDSMFTGFPGTDAPPASVKMADGNTVARKALPFKALIDDMGHSHASGVTDYNDGKMNGWSAMTAAKTAQALGYFPESQIPSYWAYARNFVLFDRFFSTHMGPTSPGHFATHSATTVQYENPDGDGDCHDPTLAGTVGVFDPDTCTVKNMFPCFDVPVVEQLLPDTLSWRAYPGSPLDKVKAIGGDPAIRTAHYRPMSKLLEDLDKGELANLTYANITSVEYDGAPASEHPPQHPCNGENYTVELVNRLMNSKYWPHMAIVFTYDDFGGWYDHVKPKTETCTNGEFVHTGFRLPAMILSPYAKKGVVDHTHTEHASIPRLIEDVFGLPRLKANSKVPWHKFVPRDATAGSMMGAFDFTQSPREPFLRTVRKDCPAPPPP
jgi:phospholipase C